MTIDSQILYYRHSAKKWVEALPIGNGKIGAMVFGSTSREKLAINYDELWTGFPRNYQDKCSYEAFAKARELVLNNKLNEAQELLQNEFEGGNSQAYVPFGNIVLDFGNAPALKYERKLDLSTGICTVSYSKEKAKYTREYFVSYPQNVLCVKISTDTKEALNMSVGMMSPVRNTVYTENEILILDGQCPSDSFSNRDYRENWTQYSDKDEEKGMCYRGAVKVISDGKIIYNEDKISISKSNYVTIYFTCESSFNGFDKHPYLNGKEYKNACLEKLNKAIALNYDDIKSEHIEDHRKYYSRVKLDLGTDNREFIPTDKRLADFARGKQDRGLYALLFNFGRYLTIAGSREGSQPTTLQGIWNAKVDAPWSSNYTVNINTEMNYWPTLMCNMPELCSPLIEMVKELSVSGEKTAKECYHARGFTSHHNVDIWRHSTPVQGNSQWSFWCMSSGWFCRHIFEQYEYTLDKNYLKETAYPLMKKSSEFYLDMLVDDGKGNLIIAPSTSPENDFFCEGKDCSVAQTSTMSMSIIKELFANMLKSAEILKIKNDSVIDEIKEAQPKLYPFKIGSKGDLIEWYNEEEYTEPHHRHVSHLYALHPARLINYDETPELIEAAKKTLEYRGDNGTGWSLGWKINFWARLRDGDHALKLINMQLRPIENKYYLAQRGGGTYPNMFDAHPPFQIDGNFGATSGIAEMLVQSYDDKIILLPALPKKWNSGKIEGILAKGNVTVDVEWHKGELTDYKIHGSNKNIKVYYNGNELTK